MRRTLGLVLVAGMTGAGVGCFTTDGKPPEPPAGAGTATAGDKVRTLEYWGKVRDLLQEKTNAAEMRQVAAVVKRQADAVRRLPIDGVDHDLYVAALQLAQNQEKMIKAAEAANYSPAALRADPDLKRAYATAGQQIASATAYLKSLQPTLSTRYHTAFPPIEDQ